jgi:signal transduction histidine kinase
MEYDVKQKVFTNFFSTKESGKGTGLGLLTTRKIVQEHGGKVSFESTEGEGSVFRLELPRSRLPQTDNNADAERGGDRSSSAQSAKEDNA